MLRNPSVQVITAVGHSTRLVIELKSQTRTPMEELVSLDNEKVGRTLGCL